MGEAPIEITRLSNLPGWYDFSNVPQGYIKVHSLNIGTDGKALKRAKRMNPNHEYVIVGEA